MANPLDAAQVFDLGRTAAEASRDAHGELVSPTMAYDFITTQALGDDAGEYPEWDRLPMELKIGFLEGYYHEPDEGGR